MVETGPGLVRECYPPRERWAKKHDFGYVAVVGGSKTFPGAPVLAALASLKSGADLAHVIGPRRTFLTAIGNPNLVPIDLNTEFLTSMSEDAWIALSRSDALVVGNGITRREEVGDTLEEILSNYSKPVVVDADALYFFSDINIKSEQVVITPHISEFRVVTGESPRSLDERIAACSEFSDETGIVVLLKGAVDIIAGEGMLMLNKTGSPYMTKGGTGDSLAGVVGALLARGVEPFRAAACGAYLNGLAGEIAGSEGLLATELIDALPLAIEESLEGSESPGRV